MEGSGKDAVRRHIEYQRDQFLKDASTLFYQDTYREACRQMAVAIDKALLQPSNKPIKLSTPEQIQKMIPAPKPPPSRGFKRLLSS